MAKRKSLTVDVKSTVLHEAGYKCGNPSCRHILTLDIHHLDQVGDGGSDDPQNLLALCPNCHALHHRENGIPIDSLRAWKMLLLAINEAYDRRSIDILLALDRLGDLHVFGDGVLSCAPLVATGLVQCGQQWMGHQIMYKIELTGHGKTFVTAWKAGDQEAAIGRPPQS
jgi:hypothetical protein